MVDAGAAFVQVLQASGLPESLWEPLTDKIRSGDLGSGGALELATALFITSQGTSAAAPALLHTSNGLPSWNPAGLPYMLHCRP